MVVSHGEVCHSIVVNDAVVAVTEVPDLFSYHEKADTRLLLHAHKAARAFSSVTIKSPDTDVMVLSLAKSQDLHGCLLLFKTGSGSNDRIINITELGIKVGQDKCQAILWLHIFTGCDNISAFKGKRKTKHLGLMLESEAFCSAFIALGCGREVPDDILPDVEKFVCTLYGQTDSAGVNAARYNLFRLTCQSEALPPNQDCLKHHLARENCQIAIHRRALERFIDAPSAVGHGWQVEDGQLVYKWMEHSPAPQSVLKSIYCKCKKSDCKGTCSCIKGGLPCNDYCQCVRELCANRRSHEVVGSGSDYDTDSDDSDVD